MFGFIIALVSGALMSIQGVFNTGVTKQTGMWVAASFVQATALVVCIGAWLVTGREGSFAGLFKIDGKYMLLGGAIGAFITYTVVQSMKSIGPARATMLIVISQLAVSYLVEVFGLFGVEKAPFEWKKLFGLAIMAGGILLFSMERD